MKSPWALRVHSRVQGLPEPSCISVSKDWNLGWLLFCFGFFSFIDPAVSLICYVT